MSGQVNLPSSSDNFDVVFSLLDVPGVRAPAADAVDAWLGSIGRGIRDLNGDGYMDFAISEFQRNGAHDGEIIILY